MYKNLRVIYIYIYNIQAIRSFAKDLRLIGGIKSQSLTNKSGGGGCKVEEGAKVERG